ncbi:hypothetical protein LUZ61_000319 [Rhynchospora tenuis]|uniref:Thioredoxin-like protein Clot n=1 Tax=Rhynchospora tenuis TaxID=198213 RepID=A0AAD5ZF86_9POAL|nr:hypothetical protein LUZ61_000319 [Rhynchospora tenuis]
MIETVYYKRALKGLKISQKYLHLHPLSAKRGPKYSSVRTIRCLHLSSISLPSLLPLLFTHLTLRHNKGAQKEKKKKKGSDEETKIEKGEPKMVLETMEAKLDDFNQVFQKFRSEEATKKNLKFILFLADKDPMTSRSWCPDCNVAEPIIYQKLETANNDIALLKVYVGDRPTWRNPNHRFRVDPRFRLQGVPTLIRWENDGITGRLEDYEAHVETKIDALLSDK